MCLDTEWFPLAEERLSEAEKKEFEIEVVPVQDVEGGAFDGFEDAFFDKGGVVGGW
jgi:alpha 1,2-mannosyltransferase